MQPWAMFIAIGLKTWETSSRDTAYRGPLLIYASRKILPEGRLIYEKVKLILGPDRDLPAFESLPRGVILCQVKLESTSRTEDILASGEITFLERALGDYGPGRFAWRLALLKKYDPRWPAKGRPGLWDFQGLGE